MLKLFLTPPVFADPEQTRKAGLLFWLLWGLIVIITVSELANCLILPQNLGRWLTILLVIDGACLGFLALNRQGETRLASHLLLWMVFGTAAGLAWTAGGIRAPIIHVFPLAALVAGLLLSWRAGILTGLLCALFALGLVLAEHAGCLPASAVQHTPFSLFVTMVLLIAVLLLLQYLAVASINQALQATQEELARRREAEVSLRKSEEFRQRIFDSSHVPIVVIDAATFHFVDGNPAAVQIYRFPSRESYLGKTVLDVSAPVQYDGTPSSEKARQFIAQAVAQGAVVFEWHHRRPDGEEWDAEVRWQAYF